MKTEIYYLSSLDSVKFGTTRICTFVRRLSFDTGKECALVKLCPPVIGQDYGLAEDIETFIVTNRHEGEGLSPITSFPCFVFVARLLIDELAVRDVITSRDVEVVAWCELYRSRSDADGHVFD